MASNDERRSCGVLQVMALTKITGPMPKNMISYRIQPAAASPCESIALGRMLENRTPADLKDKFLLNQAARNSVFVAK